MTLPILSWSRHGVAGPDRAVGAEDQEALEVRVGLHLVDRGLVAVVDAVRDAEPVADLLHLGILLLLQRHRVVGPEIVQRHRQPADEDDVLALAADRLGEGLEVRLAEGLVLDQLDVPVGVLLAGRLVHHHLDAGVLRPLQHRLERLAVVRDHADDVDLLGDEILDGAHLLRRVVGGRVDHAWRRPRGRCPPAAPPSRRCRTRESSPCRPPRPAAGRWPPGPRPVPVRWRRPARRRLCISVRRDISPIVFFPPCCRKWTSSASSSPRTCRPRISIGTLVYNPKTLEFVVHKGPIFANIVLADEINRAPAKVQSALLEAMQERSVTIGHETHRLDEPFPRPGDAESGRARRHVPAARGAARLLPVPGPGHLPVARAGAGRSDAAGERRDGVAAD